MKLNDAISAAEELRPSEVTRAQMIRWLSALDGQIWTEIIKNYDGFTPSTMPIYGDSDEHTDTVLLVEAPYDELYVDYLVMRIDLNNADYERYNNEAVQFNTQYKAWENTYNREHRRVNGRHEDGTGYSWALSF